ncbi:hypothetical protein ACIQYZ_13475 [Rhodococcus erythropolis]
MIDNWYLVDNNALSALGRHRRSTEFFRAHCRIPDEVLYEAREFPDIAELRALRYEEGPDVARRVILQLISVMRTVPTSDTDLVDLYANKGNADPIIVACALDAKSQEECTLMPATWTIVSDDRAVRTKAGEFEVAVLTGEEFKTIVDT